jgi:hypothetical protein
MESSLPRKLNIIITEYDPSVFERLIRYIHCGVVSVDVFSLIDTPNTQIHDRSLSWFGTVMSNNELKDRTFEAIATHCLKSPTFF